MKWIIENWAILVVILCALGICISYTRNFLKKPSNEQINTIREWLLFAVIEAEKIYQGGTGALKLRATYNEFCKVFPSLVAIISFDLFSELVDEALEQMKHLLDTNSNISEYVKGD